MEAKTVEMKNTDLNNLDMKCLDDFDGRDKAYWIQRVGEVSESRWDWQWLMTEAVGC